MGIIKSYSKRKRKQALTKDIINYYAEHPEQHPQAFTLAAQYIKQNGLHVFPHCFKDKYQANNIEVFFDRKVGLNYIHYHGKKLYYRKKGFMKRTQEYFNGLYIEQDIESPHRYLTQNFTVEENDIVVDIGAAEGNFSLDIIDRAKKVYLFETNKKWIKALKATFKPWQDKVSIIEKFVCDKNDEKHTTIDALYDEIGEINFIKIDVEGAEASVMQGSQNILQQQQHLKLALCTYHQHDDEKIFTQQLLDLGFQLSTPNNYMLYHDDKYIKPPYFRTGLLRAIR